tara:strand:- start:2163 stop:2462 length:300 start_codon:yes stop_codon:yes gene_type:complete
VKQTVLSKAASRALLKGRSIRADRSSKAAGIPAQITKLYKAGIAPGIHRIPTITFFKGFLCPTRVAKSIAINHRRTISGERSPTLGFLSKTRIGSSSSL